MALPYDTLLPDDKTFLHTRLEFEFGGMPAFDRLFKTSLYLSAQLGPWAADKYLEFALREQEEHKAQSRVERTHESGHGRHSITLLDREISALKRAYEIVRLHKFLPPKIGSKDLSSKVLSLFRFFQDYYEVDLGTRCIVFVTRKAVARVLKEIFHAIVAQGLGVQFMRPGAMTGHAARTGEEKVSFRQQVLTMKQFREGEVNCLFATSVAEEGLDVPDCNLVIRFDLYTTMIEYVQSKGRARHKNSKFVDMIECGNERHRQVRNNVRYQTNLMRNWIERLDPSRKLGGNDADLEKNEKHGRIFIHKLTGAKLTYWSSLTVLSLFSSTLVSTYLIIFNSNHVNISSLPRIRTRTSSQRILWPLTAINMSAKWSYPNMRQFSL